MQHTDRETSVSDVQSPVFRVRSDIFIRFSGSNFDEGIDEDGLRTNIEHRLLNTGH
jgi:hypothetical protein